eukprot:CAMPEP_0196572108 /NCGR_PEP_ID=MMETSP1081-20130531/2216_1 /TAXON_ID=36882 /ORGANISM="Pyramimonas amylifera, Strain CCMP720" /LENGTH=321 /DNA_ID=CAMNT_0041889311 /DNA_START=181 /DNA_END=1143 /DNA_ORIENTATION=+
MDSAHAALVDEEDDEEYDEELYEDEEDFEDDDDEVDEGDDQGGRKAPGGFGISGTNKPTIKAPEVPEWTTLKSFPAATQTGLYEQLSKLRESKKGDLTIMLIGKNGVGKSSTGNSIFGEKVFNVSAFQQPPSAEPQMASRKAGGFILSVIDTPGLIDGDSVNEENLNNICEFVSDKEVDAIVYVDRLDTYRLQSVDKQIMEALTSRFGPLVWDITTFVLTHGNYNPPAGSNYKDFVTRRAQLLQAAVKEIVPESTAVTPYAVVENGSRCKTNNDSEKVLPDGTALLTNLIRTIVTLVNPGKQLDITRVFFASNVHSKKNRW